MADKRTWIATFGRQIGEWEESEDVLVSTHTGKPPTADERADWAFDWMGYDEEDRENMAEEDGGWWFGSYDGMFFRPVLYRELTSLEVLLWDMARELKSKPFTLDDFMALQEEA